MIDEVDQAMDRVEGADSKAEEYAKQARESKEAIENLSVSAHKVSGNEPTVEKELVDGVIKLNFGLVSSTLKIDGKAFESLEALMTEIPSPDVGDMYNVGAGAPYRIYRWTGEEWEDQGTLKGEPGFSPQVNVAKNGETVTITVVNENTTESVTIQEGGNITINGVSAIEGNVNITAKNIALDAGDDKTVFDAIKELPNIGEGGQIIVDDELSEESDNPVQNKVVTAAINNHEHRYAGSEEASGAALSAIQLQTPVNIDGIMFDGTAGVMHFSLCDTAADVSEKVVALNGFVLGVGARVMVKFAVDNTAENPRLNVNGTGAISITNKGEPIQKEALLANQVYEFVYDGSNFMLVWGVSDSKSFIESVDENHFGVNEGELVFKGCSIDEVNGLQKELDEKVDAVSGKGLSTHDLTDELLQKINNTGDHEHSELNW